MSRRWLFAWGLGSVAFGAASLLIPLYVIELGGGPLVLGALAASAALLGAPGSILWGRLADRSGKRRSFVLASLGGAAVVLSALPFTTSIPAVVVANALLWFVAAAAGPVVTLLVVAGVPEAEWGRPIGRLNTYQGYGWAAGLVLGAVWTAVGGRAFDPIAVQRALFAFCAACAAAAGIAAARWLPREGAERLDRLDRLRIARHLQRRRRNVRTATFPFSPGRLYWAATTISPRRLVERFTPTLAAYFIAVALFFTGFAAFFAPLPVFLTDVGFGSGGVFLLYVVSSLAAAACYGHAGDLSASVDVRRLHAGALCVRGAAFPAVALVGLFVAGTPALAGLVLLFALIGLAWSIVAVTALTVVGRVAPSSITGEALGVYAALSTFAGGVGSAAGGWLAGAFGFSVAFLLAGGLVVAGAGVVASLASISALSAPTETTAPRGRAP